MAVMGSLIARLQDKTDNKTALLNQIKLKHIIKLIKMNLLKRLKFQIN